ncbi:ShlB/FhaC/HecB family hemolysin secretion/activation protein, partial [Pseudomonas aeruginosa]|uniref:ShlB/FhaC/HecB family hemolysin secretion/activation protein n=1 Tax=Pseudomonas aeruginosa TaxID=287 RepID=UPI00397D6BAF
QRAGEWALMTEQLQTRGAVWKVGLDGFIPRPGQVVALADPMLAGRANGGRISAVSGRAITVDRDVDIPVGARHWDSPLGLADQLNLRANRDAVTDRWRHSDSQSLFYSLPWGWWTFTYGY